MKWISLGRAKRIAVPSLEELSIFLHEGLTPPEELERQKQEPMPKREGITLADSSISQRRMTLWLYITKMYLVNLGRAFVMTLPDFAMTQQIAHPLRASRPLKRLRWKSRSSLLLPLKSQPGQAYSAPMLCVSVNLTSDEWLKIQRQAQERWPKEQLSRSEICRRFTLIGTEYTHTAAPLNKASKAELEQMAQELRASMTAPNDKRLQR